MPYTWISRAALLAWATGVSTLAACGGDSNEPDPPAAGLVAARATPSGDAQSGAAGQALANPLRMLVTRGGQPEAGVNVTWATSGAGAGLAPAANATDAQGIAAAAWTLSQTAGPTTATAAVAGATGSPVGFTATAVAGAATQLTLAGGNTQTAEPGAGVPDALQVKAADQFGNPVAGVSVEWQVTSGGGTVAPPTSVTSAVGVASTQFILGPAEGAQGAQGSAAGLTGSPVAFTATATVPPVGIGVAVSNNTFTPAVRTVPAGTNVVWTWTNTGIIAHSVLSTGAPSFPSSAVLSGAGTTYAHQFDVAGTYTYECEVHGSAMSGSIVVQ